MLFLIEYIILLINLDSGRFVLIISLIHTALPHIQIIIVLSALLIITIQAYRFTIINQMFCVCLSP